MTHTQTASRPREDTHGVAGSLEVHSLRKQYPGVDHAAVDDITMRIEPGDFIALLGPSGCGKTTTLRMVAGLLEPNGGRILVGGKDMTYMPVHKRGMGMVFQSYALFPHMDVADNVAFGLEMRKVPKEQRRTRVIDALKMVQLDHLADRRVKELSGGQQQRVALARALVVEPTLLLLDEPLSNLDAKLRETMRREIRQIQQRIQITTLFVTHDQDEALDMADKIAVMHGGVIEQFGSPNNIYERPRSLFVATFIGQANIFSVQVKAEGDSIGVLDEQACSSYTVVTGAGVTVTTPGATGFAGDRASLMVRPHRITITRASNAAATPSGTQLTGTVIGVSYTGNLVTHLVDVGDVTPVRVESFTTDSAVIGAGDAVSLSWPHEASYLIPEVAPGGDAQ